VEKQAQSELIVASSLCGLTQAVAHWFPWNKLTGKELEPPFNYIVGMSQILITFTCWANRQKHLSANDAIQGITAITGASGIAVIGGYVIDALLGSHWKTVLEARHGEGAAKGAH